MERYFDNIFEKLYNSEESLLWYQAREFVLTHKLYNVERGFANVVFDKVTENTLAVARQIALVAHYINYNESTGANRSVITFYGCKSYGITCEQDIKPKMKVFFGNLFEYCLYSFHDEDPKKRVILMNQSFQDSQNNNWLPIDIEFHFYKEEQPENQKKLPEGITAKEIESSFNQCKKNPSGIDITKGMLVNMVYTTGDTINNLPACDNDNVARYDTALNVYCYKLKTKHIKEIWDNMAHRDDYGVYKKVDVKNQLSSIFCADCLEFRLAEIVDASKKSIWEYLMYDFETVMKKINNNINALAYSEHNRWNVEKLILGFSPLSIEERYELECLFGQERKDKIKLLKKTFKHIDLCSNHDLRRINSGDVKYDYFLMLAMPQILLSSMWLK